MELNKHLADMHKNQIIVEIMMELNLDRTNILVKSLRNMDLASLMILRDNIRKNKKECTK